ncbi:MAG: hypothetical protein ABSG16_16085 [Candidatus Acidiferrum sp.]
MNTTLRMILGVIAAVLFLAAAALAQQAPVPTASGNASATASPDEAKPDAKKAEVVCPLSVGTAFNAKLLESVDARRNKPGDKFTAETTETVRYGRSIIFPRGTIIEGHIVRKSISTHGPDRAALFLQFDKAVLKNGQQAVMNAGIQAMAVGPTAQAPIETASANEDPDAEPVHNDAIRGDTLTMPRAFPLDTTLNADGSAKNMVAVSREPNDDHSAPVTPPSVDLPLTQGAFTKHGLLTSDSKGALGAPDIRIYTPLSEGSDGTVLMSTKKNVHLERGTRLLIVVQPPRVDPASN